jgi:hypothetical protein
LNLSSCFLPMLLFLSRVLPSLFFVIYHFLLSEKHL